MNKKTIFSMTCNDMQKSFRKQLQVESVCDEELYYNYICYMTSHCANFINLSNFMAFNQ